MAVGFTLPKDGEEIKSGRCCGILRRRMEDDKSGAGSAVAVRAVILVVWVLGDEFRLALRHFPRSLRGRLLCARAARRSTFADWESERFGSFCRV